MKHLKLGGGGSDFFWYLPNPPQKSNGPSLITHKPTLFLINYYIMQDLQQLKQLSKINFISLRFKSENETEIYNQ